MPLDALALALAAAFLHAFWNLLIARAKDPEAATAVALLVALVAYAPIAALTWRIEPAAIPYIVVTSFLQLGYVILLAAAYVRAELSVVYPIARGTAPVLVLVVGVAALGLGSSPQQAAGVCLVGLGVLLVRGLRRSAEPAGVLFGLAIACFIAAYTLVDKYGIRYAAPFVYLELSMLLSGLGYSAAIVRLRGRFGLAGRMGLGHGGRRARDLRRLRLRARRAAACLRRLGRGGQGDEHRHRGGVRGARPQGAGRARSGSPEPSLSQQE